MKKTARCLLVCLLILTWTLAVAAQDKCVITPSYTTRTRLNATDSAAAQQLTWYAQGVTAMIDARTEDERPRPEIQPVGKSRQRQVRAVQHGKPSHPPGRRDHVVRPDRREDIVPPATGKRERSERVDRGRTGIRTSPGRPLF